MNQRNYTASERRGIIAIAILSLLIIAGGVGFSFFKNPDSETTTEINEITELLDSLATENAIKEKSGKKKNKKESGAKSKKKTSSKKKSTKNTYRERSPLDEPV